MSSNDEHRNKYLPYRNMSSTLLREKGYYENDLYPVDIAKVPYFRSRGIPVFRIYQGMVVREKKSLDPDCLYGIIKSDWDKVLAREFAQPKAWASDKDAEKCGTVLIFHQNNESSLVYDPEDYAESEFGNFAAISDFQTKMTVAGGYGIRWNLFIQDFNQLMDKYGQEVAKIIQGNCHYWIYLHSQDNSTNEEISKSMGRYTTSTYSLGGSTQRYSAPSSSANIQLSERSLLNPDEVAKIQRPYQLVLSADAPAVMYSPDISKWTFNTMLGLGNKEHNTKLIDLDEKLRPERGGMSTQQNLWKPWEEQTESIPERTRSIAEQHSERPLHTPPHAVLSNKPPYFRRGGIE